MEIFWIVVISGIIIILSLPLCVYLLMKGNFDWLELKRFYKVWYLDDKNRKTEDWKTFRSKDIHRYIRD